MMKGVKLDDAKSWKRSSSPFSSSFPFSLSFSSSSEEEEESPGENVPIHYDSDG